jgi:hypothetical protein
MSFVFVRESPAGDSRSRMTIKSGEDSYHILFIGDEIGNIRKRSNLSYPSPFGKLDTQLTKKVERLVKGSKLLREFALKMHRDCMEVK